MSLAPLYEIDNKNVHGCFKHVNGNLFEFSNRSEDDMKGLWPSYDKIIYVGHDQKRYAYLIKTVAYVIVDEGENNKPIVEKWKIRNVKNY